jgi:hypothetical protein
VLTAYICLYYIDGFPPKIINRKTAKFYVIGSAFHGLLFQFGSEGLARALLSD